MLKYTHLALWAAKKGWAFIGLDRKKRPTLINQKNRNFYIKLYETKKGKIWKAYINLSDWIEYDRGEYMGSGYTHQPGVKFLKVPKLLQRKLNTFVCEKHMHSSFEFAGQCYTTIEEKFFNISEKFRYEKWDKFWNFETNNLDNKEEFEELTKREGLGGR
ncbi:MAG: hypothetical protein HRT99_04135 [Mycoplasmatales bacterium]|nr:hypothetical protein [Mycoplasmatales bacterium]